MIVFKEDTELSIVESYDEEHDCIAEQSMEVFKAGEKVDADIVSVDGPFCDLQFARRGGLALSVYMNSFDVVN